MEPSQDGNPAEKLPRCWKPQPSSFPVHEYNYSLQTLTPCSPINPNTSTPRKTKLSQRQNFEQVHTLSSPTCKYPKSQTLIISNWPHSQSTMNPFKAFEKKFESNFLKNRKRGKTMWQNQQTAEKIGKNKETGNEPR